MSASAHSPSGADRSPTAGCRGRQAPGRPGAGGPRRPACAGRLVPGAGRRRPATHQRPGTRRSACGRCPGRSRAQPPPANRAGPGADGAGRSRNRKKAAGCPVRGSATWPGRTCRRTAGRTWRSASATRCESGSQDLKLVAHRGARTPASRPQTQLRATAWLVGSAPIPAVGHGLRYSMSMAALVQLAAVAMAPDASWAVAMAGDGTVRTWGPGAAPRVIRQALAIDAGQPVAVALSGSRLTVIWAAEGTIRWFDDLEGAPPRDDVFRVPQSVSAVALSPSGRLAVAACADGTLRSLDPGTGEFGWTLATGPSAARAVALASDLGPVVAAFGDGSVRRYDLAAGNVGHRGPWFRHRSGRGYSRWPDRGRRRRRRRPAALEAGAQRPA